MSSVDDPEKHFLGNLLEDDPQSSLGPSSSGSGSATNANTTTTNTNNNNNNNNNNNIISPAFRPIGSSLVWPEPPPPYSPPLAAEPWLNGSMSDWFTSYNQDRKDSIGNGSSTLPGDSLLSFNLTNSGSSTIGESTPHIHHFHHNLHHHTHTHNVNHYFTTTPSSILTTTDLFGGDSPSLSSAPWNYAGIGSFGGEPVSSGCQISFSDWKNEVLNGGPQQKQSRLPPSPPPEASASPSPPPLSSSSIQSSNANQIEERKQQDVLKTYADASSKSTSRAKKSAIGCEKKQKQDLAKKLNNNPPTRIVVNGQPHSAPVITKMPFSYRDVAARVDNVSTNLPFIDGKEGSPVTRKNSIISSETRSLKINNNTLSEKSMKKTNVSNRENVKSSSSLSTIAVSSSENRLREQKTRAPDVNQFQTITGKMPKVTSTGIVVAAAAHQPPIMIPDAPSVKAPTRYDVLSSLESLKPRQRNGKKSRNDRAPVIEEVFSRSSSPDDEDEIMGSQEESVGHQIRKPISPKIARSISKGRGTNANIQNLTRKELKKQKVQQSQKGRQKRKVEPHWTDRMFWRIYNVLLIVLSYASSLFQWIIQLVVDDCLKIYDVVLFSTEAMFHGAWNAIKKTIYYIFILILYVFLSSWVFLRSITFTRIIEQLIYEDQPEIFEWGCRRELPVPSTAAEFIERLMREETHDAYVVLGLRSDCSDDDIKRNFKRICALVSPDKCTLEGAEDAFDLVNRAFDAIGNAESRANYTMNNAYNNEDHKFVISAWDDLRDHIEELRCTILCDCGQRHMRVSTTIRPSEARYCRRCDTMHPAKQNDIWVEKRIFGFRSVWFTCSDNVVYDISEWAMCERQRGLLKNMRVHTHSVQYRLVSPPANGELDFLTNSSTPSELASSSTASSGVGSAGGGTIVGGIQHEGRFFGEVQDEMLRHQRTLAQISFKTCEPREEDRSRRAANRRQKRWRN